MTKEIDLRAPRAVGAQPAARAVPVPTRVQVWSGLGTVLLTGAALSLLPPASEAGTPGKLARSGAGTPPLIQLAAGAEGGEGGEGAGATKAVDLGTDNVAWLTELGLMRGHLEMGTELYRQGELKAAAAQMGRPLEELYGALEPALEKRGVAGFGDRLAKLDKLVAGGAPVDRVEAARGEALSGIETAEAAVPKAARLAPATRFAVMVNLVRTAAADYEQALGPKRQVVNPAAYQDALGFVRVAKAMLDATPADGRAAEAIARAKAQFDAVAGLWPTLVPPAAVKGDPSELFGAAAYIEIASLHVR